MKNQLIILIESQGLTPAKFADEIGVQRSSISHILSDRNKPSYDFILKILNRFPEINAEWLIKGVGNMLKNTISSPKELKQTTIFDQINIEKKAHETNRLTNNSEFSAKINYISAPTEGNNEINSNKVDLKGTEIAQFTNVTNMKFVIVFYNDGTFERFNSR
jgi:transcriptional regulator with XRE-family HTH domain